MKFSVVVPVYNTERYISDCIESVLKQVYANYELILVDDGSTDNSGTICDEYAIKYNHIRVFHKSNSGQLETRCKGIAEAKGDYIIFLDSDDLLAINALSTIRDKIVEHNCDMLVYRYARFLKTPIVVENTDKRPDIIIENKQELHKLFLFNQFYNSLCIKAIRRNYFNDIDYSKLKDVRHAEDLLQTLSIIKQNPKTVIIDDVLYFYRTNINSITYSTNVEQNVSDLITVRNIVYEYLLKENVFDELELYEYKGIATKILVSGICNLAQADCSYAQKKRLFTKIKQSKYYIDYINSDKINISQLGNKKIPWFLFKFGLYRLLTMLFCMKRLINK